MQCHLSNVQYHLTDVISGATTTHETALFAWEYARENLQGRPVKLMRVDGILLVNKFEYERGDLWEDWNILGDKKESFGKVFERFEIAREETDRAEQEKLLRGIRRDFSDTVNLMGLDLDDIRKAYLMLDPTLVA